jgi:hypothetical protein
MRINGSDAQRRLVGKEVLITTLVLAINFVSRKLFHGQVASDRHPNSGFLLRRDARGPLKCHFRLLH